MREQIQAEVERKIKELEDRLQAIQEAILRYVDDLKEIITAREEPVIVTMSTRKKERKR